MAEQFIFPFTFGDRTQSDLLGGKGANLAEMVKIGLPVPPGFTITTKACQEFLKSGHSPATLPAELLASYRASYRNLSYSLHLKGYVPNPDLAGEDRPETVQAILAKVYGWLGLPVPD